MNEKLKQTIDYLKSLEDTIVFYIIARAQFKHNPSTYEPGKSGNDEYGALSLFEGRLREREINDAKNGRFTAPEERPFNKGLPNVVRKLQRPDSELVIDDYDKVNLTTEIKAAHFWLIPQICKPGDDPYNSGDSTDCDMDLVRVLAKRIHYGALHVAEGKFQDEQEIYKKLILSQDEAGLENQLTNRPRELDIIQRVMEKTTHYQKGVDPNLRNLIDPAVIGQFFDEYVIPLTRKGEVLYLLQRPF